MKKKILYVLYIKYLSSFPLNWRFITELLLGSFLPMNCIRHIKQLVKGGNWNMFQGSKAYCWGGWFRFFWGYSPWWVQKRKTLLVYSEQELGIYATCLFSIQKLTKQRNWGLFFKLQFTFWFLNFFFKSSIIFFFRLAKYWV